MYSWLEADSQRKNVASDTRKLNSFDLCICIYINYITGRTLIKATEAIRLMYFPNNRQHAMHQNIFIDWCGTICVTNQYIKKSSKRYIKPKKKPLKDENVCILGRGSAGRESSEMSPSNARLANRCDRLIFQILASHRDCTIWSIVI
jgi:hypothetical protein